MEEDINILDTNLIQNYEEIDENYIKEKYNEKIFETLCDIIFFIREYTLENRLILGDNMTYDDLYYFFSINLDN
jgi:hypothetical protein